MTTPTDMPEDVELPCGCLLTFDVIDGVNTMTAHACRAGCHNIAMILQEADAQGKTAEVREV